MRVYFLAAVSAKQEFGDLYVAIVGELKTQGHSVVVDHVLTDSSLGEKLSAEKRQAYFDQMRRRISACDVVVCEVSKTTPNVAYEISYALEKDKLVLALYVNSSNYELPLLLEGNTYDRFLLMEYSRTSLSHDISEGMKEVSSLVDIRFNFLISPEQVDFLSKMSKQSRVARSVYLRGLIAREIENDKDYQKTESARGKSFDE